MAKVSGLVLGGAALALAVGGVSAHPGHQHSKAAGAHGAALICPVMKSPIKDRAKAPHVMVNNVPVYFCCADCPASFKKEPAKYLKSAVKDPVTGKPFKVTAKTPKIEHGDTLFLFSSAQTQATFRQHPGKYVKPHAS